MTLPLDLDDLLAPDPQTTQLLLPQSEPEGPLADLLRGPGNPKPQGSKRARPIYRGSGTAREFTGRVAVMEQLHEGVTAWREDVRAAVERVREGQPPLVGALLVELGFVMPRPASTPKRRTPRATKRPDLDKLCRSSFDALQSAGAYKDDSQVVDLHATKRIAEIGERTGCLIRIGVLP